MEYLESIRAYWDTRASGYSQKSIDELSSESAEVWENRLKKLIPEKKVLNCIDIGCGPGFIGILLAKMGHKVTLCDYSENMLTQAKINAKAQGVSVNIKRCDAQNPDFEDGTFDVVVSRNLVWNLESPETAYNQWLRILKDGGKLIVFDGNHYLHEYNENYKEEKKCPHYKDPHTKEYMQGVDPSVINNIALNLPLSRFERPYWDIEFFIRKRIKNIYTEPVWNDFIGIDGNKKTVIKAFTVCVEK